MDRMMKIRLVRLWFTFAVLAYVALVLTSCGGGVVAPEPLCA